MATTPSTAPGDRLVYEGPGDAINTPTGPDSGDITSAGVMGVHYQKYETVTLSLFTTWDGGGADNNWTTPANWFGDIAPVPGSRLLFPADAPADSKTNTNNFPADTNFGSITLAAGYNIGGNALTLSNGLQVASSGTIADVSFPITLTQAQTFEVLGGIDLNSDINLNGFALNLNSESRFFILGAISGSGGLTKTGSNLVDLRGNNSYTGVTNVVAGTLAVGNNNALGATGTGNHTVVASGATLAPDLNVTGLVEAFTFNGGTMNAFSCGNGCTLTGPITLGGDLTLDGGTTGGGTTDTLTLSGVISQTVHPVP